MEIFHDANAFEPDFYKGVAQMNSDIVNCTIKLFNGDSDTYGMTTSGGTESICSSIAAYKLMARKERGITKPNLVLFDTAHAAFPKACYYFNIETRMVFAKNGYADPERLRSYIDSNTIAIVASACNYAHGAIDDIKAFGKIALEYKIGLHVDNCLGGFVNCFGEEFNKNMPPFDFRVKGVTSISADTHKYGYGPKGMSVMMCRPRKLFECLRFTSLEHAGAPFTMGNLGTYRSGAIVAGTWTALMKTGYKGYVEKSKKIFEKTEYIRREIKKMSDIKLFGPDNGLNMICFDGKGINPLRVALKMKELSNWSLSKCQKPDVCHFLISSSNVEMAEKFVEDLKKAVELIKKDSKVKNDAYMAIYGATTVITDKSMVDEMLFILIDGGYSTTSERARMSMDID